MADLHICGMCMTQFSNINEFFVHKKDCCTRMSTGLSSYLNDTTQPMLTNVCFDNDSHIMQVLNRNFENQSEQAVKQSFISNESDQNLVLANGQKMPQHSFYSHQSFTTQQKQIAEQNLNLQQTFTPVLTQPLALTALLISQPLQQLGSFDCNSVELMLSTDYDGQQQSTNLLEIPNLQLIGQDGIVSSSGTVQLILQQDCQNIMMLREQQEPQCDGGMNNAVEINDQQSEIQETGISQLINNDKTSQSSLKNESASQRKKFTCQHEGCSFSSCYQKDLDRHSRIHTGEKPYICSRCTKAFTRSDKLKMHMRGHTGNKPFACSQCTYRTNDGSSLKKHNRIHSDERPFKCQICKYASRNSSQLVVHLRTHTGDSPFVCEICRAKFKINSDLKRHLRLHSGEKPYSCDMCDYKCAIKGNLKSHFRSNHSQDCVMECKICSFKTSSHKTFREHNKIHVSTQKHACPVCDSVCDSQLTLRAHKLQMHADDSMLFQCDQCSYASKQEGNIRKHIQRRHLNKQNDPVSGKSNDDIAQCLNIADKSTDVQPGYKKPYACNQCPMSFVRLDSYHAHERCHQQTNVVEKCQQVEDMQDMLSTAENPAERVDQTEIICNVFQTETGYNQHAIRMNPDSRVVCEKSVFTENESGGTASALDMLYAVESPSGMPSRSPSESSFPTIENENQSYGDDHEMDVGDGNSKSGASNETENCEEVLNESSLSHDLELQHRYVGIHSDQLEELARSDAKVTSRPPDDTSKQLCIVLPQPRLNQSTEQEMTSSQLNLMNVSTDAPQYFIQPCFTSSISTIPLQVIMPVQTCTVNNVNFSREIIEDLVAGTEQVFFDS